MKRYKIEYWDKERSNPSYLIQLSKSGKRDGVRISFWNNGKKDWQDKFKNGVYHGLHKYWTFKFRKNKMFRNLKKNKPQGIIIIFKQNEKI